MTAVPNLAISGWAAVSAYGADRDAFVAAVRAGRPAPRVAAPEGAPPGEAFRAADFDVVAALGPKGTGSMDRASGMAIAAVGALGVPQRHEGHLHDVQRDEGGLHGTDRVGVVLGTTSGSAQTQHNFTRDSLTRRRPYFVNPAQLPFALMNSAASRCASWHGLRGPNSTVAAGRLSGVAVLRYAARLLATGRADALVCGAVEEYGPARAWLERARWEWHRQSDAGDPLGEGAAVFLLEPAGDRPPLAEVLATDTAVAVDGDPRAALARCLRRLLAAAGVAAVEVRLALPGAAGGPLAEAERAAVVDVLGREPEAALRPGALVGDVGAATGPFQVLTALALRPGVALATAVDPAGVVGGALLRAPG
ncbi:3-oxoacyl-[acyl-carrier-protein] synthase II [Amycolatopsis arida]|uniref:3-oxoacyl-[acyl-carrier-protein] synthase II n=1 Tax=Amycolatopsis arida TaxID=587909 RepID=A0A1I5X210_9PSEU|nr:beta-ketoacyl synthase N-terminal-like domain-containing protein [Amycolatopsis arida]TDX92560.1 3-oxoacyl-[acyl-carrier-protein] synthase II [Amycolatopsis arida]SFQ25866.1 3-oxoacyl-[acyl-carrier-protein] synthase II [Amycolatopsis arida]